MPTKRELARMANALLGPKPKKSLARDIEKLEYEAGVIAREDLKFYDPDNDWDTVDSARETIVADIDTARPTVAVENTRKHAPAVDARQALAKDPDNTSTDDVIVPALGQNTGERKTCRKCGKSKGLGSFSPKNDAKDGKHPWCRPCRKTVS